LKVLIIISNCGIGGSQRVAMHLAKWLNGKENSLAKIVSLKKTTGNCYDMNGYDYVELSENHVIKKLRNLIKNENPDIVLSMGVPMAIYTVPASMFLNVKHVISERNDPSHFSGKPMIKYLSRFLMRFASGYVFQTRDAQKFYGMVDGKKSIVIANPLSEMQNMPTEIFSGFREKKIVSVGRLNKQKNHSLLIDAFADIVNDYPEYKLVIWGEGDEREKLENKIKQMGLKEKVLLPGATKQVFDKINSSTMFVLSSDFEGMPNALMEAMALGLPVVSTDCPCGGPHDLIQDGENGFLVPVGDREKLKEKMIMILDSLEIQNRFSKKAFSIRDEYNLERICKKWYEYFQLVVEDK